MHPLTTQRPTVAEIDLADLSFNFHSVREFVGRDIAYMAVVKANAYGHGAIECARQLEKDGVDWFGVAIPEEGVELRNAGITKPILSLGSFWHGQEELLLRHNITPVIYRLENAESLDKFAGQQGRKLSVHVKVDTGMGRIGVQFSEITAFAEKLKSFPNLQVEGIMTHFASADDLCQNEFTDRQISDLQTAAEIFRAKGFAPIYVDMANSSGVDRPSGSLGNMVRLGGVLYGLGGDVLPPNIAKPELKPVLSLTTQVAHIKIVLSGTSLGYGRTFVTERESTIATLPIGYFDGIPRSLSNRGRVLIDGAFAPIVGRISMDWTIVDVTDIADVGVGSSAVLIGNQGGLEIPS